ncbi:flagellar hook-length control protein FliK [Methylomonas sp. MO1]|uniref:flagellar hook-length control protein FliK n=1 Tax=unclassified Methylomonas TaxID=2608980 RepID=UPI00047C4182|nr:MULTISPECIES: flagellar hook-length control protein FliK [unclassified Methylomonas]MDT4288202.1 flagellar hook-length control protein FliK [Methylomonas sp. MO1]
MNIQGLNPLSLLASADSASVATTGLLGEGGGAGVFSATLLEQLAQLQNSLLSKGAAGDAGLANLQQLGGLGADTLNSQSMQDFTALFGKSLPTATKLGQDINLDDTMQALADVLQYLQGLEAATVTEQQAPVLPVTSANQDNFAEIAAENTETANEQAENAAMLAGMQAQPLPVADSVSGVNEVLKSAVATSEAMSAVKNSPELLGMDAKKEALTALNGTDEGRKAMAAESGFAKTLAAEEGASQQFAQDNAANAFQTEQGDVPKHQMGGSEADVGLSRMTADIAQMNKSVNNAGQTPAPAIEKHLTHPEWNTDLGEKLLWMHKQAVPSAEIRLNPEHLGPISIKIDVNQDQASVVFTAQHAAVRDAIEAAIPKLREMLGGQNLNLADVNVSQQQSEQRPGRESFQTAGEQNRGGNSQGQGHTDSAATDTSNAILEEIEAGRAIASNGLLSLFA